MSVAQLDEQETKALADVLSFYSSQVTSHAGLDVGFVVAFLTMPQVRFNTQFSSSSHELILLLLLAVVTGGVYAGFRLALYGTLSGVIMHAGVSSYRAALAAFGEETKDWAPLVKATMFSEWHLKNNTLKKNKLRRVVVHSSGRIRFLASLVMASFIVL